MEILKYLLLAVVQGLTETIPVSSSGHLMIIKKLISLDVEPDKYFGALSNFMPTSCPYAAVTIKSGFNATISSYSFLIFSG